MKKKFIIPLIICLVLIISIIGFVLWNNRTVSTIFLDINPSIEINLNKKGIVKSVKALNKDAEYVIDNLKGKTLEDSLDKLTENLIEKDYIKDPHIEIILYTEGNINKENVINKVSESFNKNEVDTSIIVVESISKEDKELSKKYDISPSKASYINSIKEDNENIDVETLIEKPVEELKETKETGKYCDVGYSLEGDFCVKEIRREKASSGKVCPEGYTEYNNKCYEDAPFIELEEYECNDKEKTLVGNKCTFKEYVEATPNFTCEKGDLIKREHAKYRKFRDSGDGWQYVCEDKSNAKAPTLRCLLNPGHIMIGGKCYNGPAPVINGGCPNGDTLRNGKCYSKDNEDQWQCPDGNIYEKSKETYEPLCPDTFKYTIATGNYSCNEGYTLEGNKCTKDIEENAQHKKTCSSGYILADGYRCINKNKTTDYIDGYVCNEPQTRLKGNYCVYYEEKDAKKE